MKKKGTILIIIGVVFILAAVGLFGYNYLDNKRAQRASNDIMEKLGPIIAAIAPIPEEGRLISGGIEYPEYVINPKMDMPVKNIDGNNFIGVISIPAIGKEFPVFDEWNYDNLSISACRYSGSAYLNNMVLCAHNYDSHFGMIKNLRYGDQVIFVDMKGNRFTYQVLDVETLKPTAIEDMITGDWDLSLFTCTTSGAARVTVRCERIVAGAGGISTGGTN